MSHTIAHVLPAFMEMMAGHIPATTPIIDRYAPGCRPWLPRAIAVFYLYPETREGRCGVIDLLHPSERHTPRCGVPGCRCMQGEEQQQQEGIAT